MGIGKDINNSYALDVSGNLNITGGTLTINGDPLANSAWTSATGGIAYTGGRVGIGISSLDRQLTVNSTINTNTAHVSELAITARNSNFPTGGSGAGFLISTRNDPTNSANNRTEFYTNNTGLAGGTAGWSGIPPLTIKHNGNVGIGTDTMASKCKIQSTDSQTTLEVVNTGGGFALGHAAMYNYVAANTNNVRCLTCNSVGFSNILDAYSSGSVCIRKTISGNKYPLEVGSSSLGPTDNYTGLLYFNGLQIDKQFTTPSISIFSEQGVMMGSLFLYSDKRIKKNIVDLSDNECLEKLRLLKPCKYQYIDNIKKGISYVYGFIAQEVKDVINYSVDTNSQIIPDYYNLVEISNADVSFIEFDLSNNIQYDLSLNQRIRIIVEYSANIDDTEKLFKEYDTEVLNIQGKTIKIKNETNNKYIHKIFLYGKEIEDFHNLKKDAIWTVATSALQEVDRIQQRHQEEITQLKDEMNTLKSQYQSLVSRLEALENK